MNRYRVQSIELLGLFAALVSFVVSSVQFISGSGIEYFLLGDVVIAFWGDELTVVTDDAVPPAG